MIKAFMNKNIMLQVLFFGLVCLILGFVMLINFVDASIVWERLFDGSFWFQYSITIFVSLIAFFLTVQGEKIKLSNTSTIQSVLAEISALFDYVSGNDGLYTKMKLWLDEKNSEKAFRTYITGLKRKREKMKRQKDIDAIDAKILRAKEDIEYIDVKYFPKSINLLFAGFATKDEDEILKYNGLEKMGYYLIPAIVGSLVFTTLVLLFILTPAVSTMEKIIQTASRIICIGTYIFKAYDYSRYSVLDRYKATLESRKAVIKSFFDEIGYPVEIENNPYYAFRVEKGKHKEENNKCM